MHGHLTVVRYLLQQELNTELLLADRKVMLHSKTFLLVDIKSFFISPEPSPARHLENLDILL